MLYVTNNINPQNWLSLSLSVSPPTSLTQPNPRSSATKLAACGHFGDKSPFLPFLPAPDTKANVMACLCVWPQTRTDSVRTCLVSLIYNSQFRCTELNRRQNPGPAHAAAGINPLVS